MNDGFDAGDVGWRRHRYLLKTVAVGDGNHDLSTPLTRYYTEAGTPVAAQK